MRRPGGLGRVCLILLTDLIIRDRGKLLCQLLERFMLFGWYRLGGIWGSEGLDKGICWGFCGCDGVFYFGYELWAMSAVRGSLAERGGGLEGGRVHRDPSRSK